MKKRRVLIFGGSFGGVDVAVHLGKLLHARERAETEIAPVNVRKLRLIRLNLGALPTIEPNHHTGARRNQSMLAAYLTAENEALKAIFSDPDKFTGADPFLFLFAAVIILVFGPGKFSLDHLIGIKLRATTPTPRA